MAFSIYSNIWKARNKWRFDGIKLHHQIITLNILTDIADATHLSKNLMHNTARDLKIIKALNVHCKPRHGSNIENFKWWLPTPNEVKIYCDDLSLSNTGDAGIGIIYKNNIREVLGTYSKSIGHATNFIAEITTIIQGIHGAITNGWMNFWVVSDSATAINAYIKDIIPWALRTT
ncbi:hypothetical protein GIB67_029529 [Kingdonia uniflora]|uniref:RNase H type-1 domain-containing protein n=1 Tax=Kingdonia uniflora TaxID=39325 RepID=A0A7J7NY19_9MAGN|nr:hypothetical protein GIB67_029529 [Kingdonia uniflora]